jgi:hypothetical protein
VGAIPSGPTQGTGDPVPAVIVQVVSDGLKPVPATPTCRPCPTLAGSRTIIADGVPTVKKPVAADPVASMTYIPYVPGTAAPGAVREPDT